MEVADWQVQQTQCADDWNNAEWWL